MKLIKNISLAVLSGVIFSLSWPEIGNQAWLIFVTFIPLFFIIEKIKNWRTIFLYSFLGFFVWHLLSCWWMWPSTPIGSLSAWSINSLLMASVISFSKFSAERIKWMPFELILAFYWLSFEIFHLYWDLKWPWMNLGHVFANHIEWIQWYEYTGVHGGTFWVILVNGFLFSLIKQINILLIVPKFRGNKKMMRQFLISLIIIVLPILISKYLYRQNLSNLKPLKLSIVQPNIDTYTEKFDALPPLQQSEKLIQQLAGIDSNSLVLLPETVIPESFYLSDSLPKSIDTLIKFSQQNNLKIIGGFNTKDDQNLYNSACFIEEGQIKDSRNKIKLLAYAEKIPFDYISKKWSQMVHKQGGIEKSYGVDKSANVFTINDSIKVGTLICFESVFSDITAEICRNGAQVIFIITNDDWWYDTPGHRQHFAYARIKAIETRKWIARSANTGVSGIINPNGEIIQSSDYRAETIISGKVYLNSNQSFFTKNEKQIRVFILIGAIFIMITSFLRKKKTEASF